MQNRSLACHVALSKKEKKPKCLITMTNKSVDTELNRIRPASEPCSRRLQVTAAAVARLSLHGQNKMSQTHEKITREKKKRINECYNDVAFMLGLTIKFS